MSLIHPEEFYMLEPPTNNTLSCLLWTRNTYKPPPSNYLNVSSKEIYAVKKYLLSFDSW